jgi:opacity protein-like surface antigen
VDIADSASNCTPAAGTVAFFGAGANGFGYCLGSEQKLRNLSTARGRAGFLVNNALWYAPGGAAWATVKDTYQFSGSANPIIFPGVLQPGPFLPGGADFSTRRSGWTLGGGVEARLWGDWSAKLEYLYVDLGSVTEAYRRRNVGHHNDIRARQYRPGRAQLQIWKFAFVLIDLDRRMQRAPRYHR